LNYSFDKVHTVLYVLKNLWPHNVIFTGQFGHEAKFWSWIL